MTLWPEALAPSATPLRKIIRSSSAKRKRAIRSPKAGGHVECESDHEADFVILAELDPNVSRIYSQPFRWEHWFQGNKKVHWPDFGLEIAGCAEIHEIKERAKLNDDMEWETRCDWAAWSSNRGVPYSLTLDIHLQKPVPRRCIDDLWYEHNRQIDPFLTLRVQSLLEDQPRAIGAIIDAMPPPKPLYCELLALAAQGKIYVDTSHDFSDHTLVRFPDPANPPPRLIPFFPPQLGMRP